MIQGNRTRRRIGGAFRAIPLLAVFLAGCAGTKDLDSSGFPSDIAGRPTIAAVTTRKPAHDPRNSPWFGSERGTASIAQVNLTSPYLSGRFSMAATGLSNWQIKSVEPVSNLPVALASGGNSGRDVLLYIHGFNETFENATLDAARLSDALGFRGDTAVFSWPSRASVLGYMADRESAVWSRDALEETLESLLSSPGVGRVHIVAHSMGSMLTVEALRQVSSKSSGYASRLGAVVFASPDIDIDSFSASVQRLGDIRRRMVVVSGTDDRALAISAGLAGGRRVGRVEKASIEELGIKVVDASGLSSGLLRHDLFLRDSSVQKVIAEAIKNAGGQAAAVTPFAVPPTAPVQTPTDVPPQPQ